MASGDKKIKRDEHCEFANIHKVTGKCVAWCHHQQLIRPGVMMDCIGIESEAAEEYFKRIKGSAKLH